MNAIQYNTIQYFIKVSSLITMYTISNNTNHKILLEKDKCNICNVTRSRNYDVIFLKSLNHEYNGIESIHLIIYLKIGNLPQSLIFQ